MWQRISWYGQTKETWLTQSRTTAETLVKTLKDTLDAHQNVAEMDMEIDDDVNEATEDKIVVENAQNVVETPVNKVVIDWFKCETEF